MESYIQYELKQILLVNELALLTWAYLQPTRRFPLGTRLMQRDLGGGSQISRRHDVNFWVIHSCEKEKNMTACVAQLASATTYHLHAVQKQSGRKGCARLLTITSRPDWTNVSNQSRDISRYELHRLVEKGLWKIIVKGRSVSWRFSLPISCSGDSSSSGEDSENSIAEEDSTEESSGESTEETG
jgi:hypothetical protein